MAFVCPNVGEVLLLKLLLNNVAATDPRLHLYSNSVTLTESVVLGDLDEVTATGYTSISLPGSQWTFQTVSGTTTASFATQSFTMSTSATINGFFLTDNSSASLYITESISTISLPSAGGEVNVEVVLTLD